MSIFTCSFYTRFASIKYHGWIFGRLVALKRNAFNKIAQNVNTRLAFAHVFTNIYPYYCTKTQYGIRKLKTNSYISHDKNYFVFNIKLPFAKQMWDETTVFFKLNSNIFWRILYTSFKSITLIIHKKFNEFG